MARMAQGERHASLDLALRDREARLAAVLETAVDGIITIDEHGIIESVNAATERIFGYSESELVGQPIELLMPEPYRSRHAGYMRAYLETGVRRIIGIGREVEALRRDGTTFPADLAISEFESGGNRLFTGILRDLTARKSAEAEAKRRLDELAHASRLSEMGEMTSGIAHEVNQPLAAIVSFAKACLRMMDGDAARPEVMRDALGQIAEQAQRAGKIVHHLRQFARKGEVEHELVDVNETLLGVLALVEHEMRTRRVGVALELSPGLPAVSANRIQIEQVALNLMRNGIEAMVEGGAEERVLGVRTALADGGKAIEVAISDSGIGLTDDVRARLFDTFFTTKTSGVGVGLSISRSLVESHGGRLWAAKVPGDGAAFHFTLPLPGSSSAGAAGESP